MPQPAIFVVDDEKNIRRSFEIILKPEGYTVESFESGELFLQRVQGLAPGVVFLDVMLPGMNGVEVLKKLKAQHPGWEVVMVSGHAQLSTAVEATRAGAYDFLEKPLQKEKILLTIRHLQEKTSLQNRFVSLQEQVSEEYQLVGTSAKLNAVLQKVQKVAPTDSKVLITGESGVGKELVAFAIHRNSARRDGPFVKMNCAAIPEELTESELFGSEKGAFTGALQRREGKFSQADGGTLFLDEIGDMSLSVQTKVLRVLQDGEYQRVGGKEVLKADVRIVAATNRNIEEQVASGAFREDLYFRLNVLPIVVPPLRERPEDIGPLTDHFLRRFCRRNNRRVPVLEPQVLSALQNYHWPGNVRELQNLVERLVILSENERVTTADLPPNVFREAPVPVAATPGSLSLAEVRETAERQYILRCLQACRGNVSQTARLLGIERTNLHKRMKYLGIKRR